MKKFCLTLCCFFTLSLAFAQKATKPDKKVTDPNFFKMDGKPIPNQKCFLPADFRKKLEITANIDSISYADIFIVRGKLPLSNIKLNSLNQFNSFDLYSWLISGENAPQGTFPTTTKNLDGTSKKFKPQPADRLSIDVMYYQEGEKKSISINFAPFCGD
jgi:hypothetical protein